MTTRGQRIKQRRKELGLTQGDLADLAKVSQQLVSKLENDLIDATRAPFSLARALDTSAEWLEYGDIMGAREDTTVYHAGDDGLFDEILDAIDVFIAKTGKKMTAKQIYNQAKSVYNEIKNDEEKPSKDTLVRMMLYAEKMSNR